MTSQEIVALQKQSETARDFSHDTEHRVALYQTEAVLEVALQLALIRESLPDLIAQIFTQGIIKDAASKI